MKKIRKGDYVVRKSHGKDIVFYVSRVIDLKENKVAILKGIINRVEVDSSIDDLELIDKKRLKKELDYFNSRIKERVKKINRNSRIKNSRSVEKIITGKILHLDGDKRYSEKSLYYYRKLGLNAIVRNISENRQPLIVYQLLKKHNPDILVVTGHDGMIKKRTQYNNIYNYRNSKYFVETVKEARRYEALYNKNIAIFAGACQSYYEAIMLSGANFASSPARILIDFLDPLILAENIAYTDRLKFLTIKDVEDKLRDGKKGIDGIGTTGKMIIVK